MENLMNEIDFFTLSEEQQALARTKGFQLLGRSHWILSRKSDGATVWPHVDGYISVFERDGLYVKHKKFRHSLEEALTRKFGDRDDRVSDEMFD